jgi:polyhydroxyalkanoate synthesis regulator phasin
MAAKKPKTATRKSTTKASASRSRATSRSRSSSASRSTVGADKSVQAFRDALDRSVTLSRDRIQDVVDDAVKRGRMTRGDANELVSSLVERSRKYRDDLVKDLEKLLRDARKEVESRVKEVDKRVSPTRKRVEKAAGRAGRVARDAADGPLARADSLRRRAGVASGTPIAGYEQLTAPQIKKRLRDMDKPSLRKVRTQEKRGKARKSILDEVEKLLK